MAFTSTIEPVAQPVQSSSSSQTAADASLMTMLVLSVYAANHSKKAFRKLRRKFLWTAFKLRIQSIFSPKKAVSNRQLLIYILIAVVFIILLTINAVAALVLALLALILLLSGAI
jgi:hypothetical protein